MVRAKTKVSLVSRALAMPLLVLVRIYQWTLSPVMGGQCRYWPTCSHYAAEALQAHGGIRGGWMAAKRLLRCHPFSRGGYDPVPPAESPPL